MYSTSSPTITGLQTEIEHLIHQLYQAELQFGDAIGLFGQNNHGERSWIMVTLPSEAAKKPKLIEQIMANGMNIACINTSHDDPEVWKKMIKNIRRAERKTGKLCKVYFDLAGPKIRTDFTDMRLFNKERKVKKGKLCLFPKDLLFIAIHPKDCPSLKKSKLPKSLVGCIGLT